MAYLGSTPPRKVSKRPSAKQPTRSTMVNALRAILDDGEYDEYGELEEAIDDMGIISLSHATMVQVKQLYTEFVNLLPSSKPTINSKEFAVERFDATIITDKSRRLVNISIEDGDGKFLTPDLERHERPLGGEMPVFLSLPQELYEAIRAA
jgi:hypothetical protein